MPVALFLDDTCQLTIEQHDYGNRGSPVFSSTHSMPAEKKAEIYQEFRKVISFRNIFFVSHELFHHLSQRYRFSSHPDINSFKKDYWGTAGFKKFAIHFIRPGTWDEEYRDINSEMQKHVFENLHSIFNDCNKKI